MFCLSHLFLLNVICLLLLQGCKFGRFITQSRDFSDPPWRPKLATNLGTSGLWESVGVDSRDAPTRIFEANHQSLEAVSVDYDSSQPTSRSGYSVDTILLEVLTSTVNCDC